MDRKPLRGAGHLLGCLPGEAEGDTADEGDFPLAELIRSPPLPACTVWSGGGHDSGALPQGTAPGPVAGTAQPVHSRSAHASNLHFQPQQPVSTPIC